MNVVRHPHIVGRWEFGAQIFQVGNAAMRLQLALTHLAEQRGGAIDDNVADETA